MVKNLVFETILNGEMGSDNSQYREYGEGNQGNDYSIKMLLKHQKINKFVFEVG